MILNRLTLCNFRAYAGVHDVDLVPRVKYGAVRPLILVGGLNGTGKTTLLMAVKLALYGRHAVGMGTSRIDYSQFIRECIHTVAGVTAPEGTFVELDFTYGKLGRRHRYVVRRGWKDMGRSVRETLTLQQEGEAGTHLSTSECQGFLNELVPLGVSDLFFFDGEKIADLAEDDTGRALGDALRRLLGLDLVERLRSDLRVYMHRSEASAGDKTLENQIDDLRKSYEEHRAMLARRRGELATAKVELDELKAERDRLELRLTELGGEWGRSRQTQQAEANRMAEAVGLDERELRSELAGIYPLALVDEALREALHASATNLAFSRVGETNGLLRCFASTLKSSLDEVTHPLIDCVLTKMLQPESRVEPVAFDLSEKALGRMERAVQYEIPKARDRVREIATRRAQRQDDLQHITVQIERAPDQASLITEFSALTSLNERIVEASADVAVHERELKLEYSRAIKLARSLRDEHKARSERTRDSISVKLAASARLLLRDFQEINAKHKIERLGREFITAFQRLMQKDVVAQAHIDPRRFTVTLMDVGGSEVPKSQLSAGEKQIYAIAMLEALARMSGRRLPVVIDTPLGRLDSRHRTNLVNHYFPSASHQVILLSTDTEIDGSFFRSLSPHVSHAFEILYDERECAARLHEGYFWRGS